MISLPEDLSSLSCSLRPLRLGRLIILYRHEADSPEGYPTDIWRFARKVSLHYTFLYKNTTLTGSPLYKACMGIFPIDFLIACTALRRPSGAATRECSLLIVHCSLLIVNCSLLIVHC